MATLCRKSNLSHALFQREIHLMQGNNTTAETGKPDVVMTDAPVGVIPVKVLARRLRLLRLRVRCPFPPR
jgi:hypothetical protein